METAYAEKSQYLQHITLANVYFKTFDLQTF